jgi:hypothetical protein
MGNAFTKKHEQILKIRHICGFAANTLNCTSGIPGRLLTLETKHITHGFKF